MTGYIVSAKELFILTPSQYGFCKGCYTELALIKQKTILKNVANIWSICRFFEDV